MKTLKLTDHFGNSDTLEIGDIEKDYQVVPFLMSNNTDHPIRIMLNRTDIMDLAEHIEKLIDELD